jgi:hypothetical protein
MEVQLVENLGESRLMSLVVEIDETRKTMAEILWYVYEKSLYLKWGHESFSDFVEVTLGIPTRFAQWTVKVWNMIEEQSAAGETWVRDLQWGIIVELAKIPNPFRYFSEEFLREAQFADVHREVNRYLNDIRSDSGAGVCTHIDEALEDSGVSGVWLRKWMRENREMVQVFLDTQT